MEHTVILKENRDFRRLYGKGKSAVHPLLVVYALPNQSGWNRLGVVSSKKIGNAVQRNRARRILRQAYYQTEGKLKSGYDLILVSRTKTVRAKSTDLVPVFLHLAGKLDLLAQDGPAASPEHAAGRKEPLPHHKDSEGSMQKESLPEGSCEGKT